MSNSQRSGNGGKSGNGGTVVVNGCDVYAYNGSYITSVNSGATNNEWGKYQCPIYAQLGISLDEIRAKNITSITARIASVLMNELSSKSINGSYFNYTNKLPITLGNEHLGIGAGAGYTEGTNGVFVIK